MGSVAQLLSSALPRDVAVRHARLRTGESLDLGIFRRRMQLDLTIACRWCCVVEHVRLAPPPPPAPILAVVSTSSQVCPECGNVLCHVAALRGHYARQHPGVALPTQYIPRPWAAPKPSTKAARVKAAPAPPTYPRVISTAPHRRAPSAMGSMPMCN